VVTEPDVATSSRRALLSRSAAGIVAGAAVAITGCGANSGTPDVHKIPPEARNVDVEILNGLLDREYKAIAAYTAGIPLLDSHVQTAAKQFLSQEISHAGELYALIKQAKGIANHPQSSYSFGHPRTHKQVVDLLHALEQSQISGYLEAIPSVSPGSVRAALASILANDAQHVVVLRRALRIEPIPSPFVTAAE
jgi:bacterioferritin (cytochrome b1)